MVKKTISILLFIFIITWVMLPSVHASVIYIVKPGDTLWQISDQYNLNQNEIVKINGLSDQNKLVPGQPLLLNSQTYIVQKGDTLWEIANRHQVSLTQLMDINNVHNSIIRVGQKLKIPKPKRTNIMIGAFAYPFDIISGDVKQKYKFLSHIAAFEYHPDGNGKLNELANMEQFKNIVWKNDMIPYATVTNLSSEGFDHILAHDILSNPEKRKTLIEEIYTKLDRFDLKGVVIDFEGLDPKDRNVFNQFIKQLASRLHPINMKVGIAVPPLQGDRYPSWNAAYDYKTLGKYADSIFLMTYDWHWLGGEPGPISPINRVKQTLAYGTSVIPKEKIIMGIPLYAYDWPIKRGKSEAQAYSQMYALKKALDHGSTIHYDVKSASPWFRYTDENGMEHEVWFEDARSVLAKYKLVKEFGIWGVGGWQIKFNFPQAEQIISEQFK